MNYSNLTKREALMEMLRLLVQLDRVQQAKRPPHKGRAVLAVIKGGKHA